MEINILFKSAHPGIIKMVDYVEGHMTGEIYLVMGGFHLLDNPLRKIK
jgi:metal-dependent hydrolase (beta-lactamase superfamily II)